MRRLCTLAVGTALCLAVASSAGLAAGNGGAAPSCSEGPAAAGGAILGTPCDDLIVVPPGVAVVNGGGGDDTIVAAPITAAASCPEGCRLGIGSQTFEGGPGNDTVYGERGNDRLFGGEGSDQLFGGIGDDALAGGPGNDRLSGGFGGDSIDGEAGDDYVRGDATKDTIVDRGGGTDTLSYSTGIAPGFFDGHALVSSAAKGLPPEGGERGVFIDLSGTVGDNGVAPFGGGVDSVEGVDFETVIGTPFSDYIAGSSDSETIYGGGGGDAILGRGGDDVLHGGADGDHLDGGADTNTLDGGVGSDHCENATPPETSCESAVNKGGVIPHDAGKVSIGSMAPGATSYTELYFSGSGAADKVTATYASSPSASVTFALGSAASFDESSGCDAPAANSVVCPLAGRPLDSIVLAGFGDNDVLKASGFPTSVSVIIAGGEGNDELTGGDESEDVLADGPDESGPGKDILNALGGDDALLNNGGADKLFGGPGNDLFLSDSICDGDLLDGGAGSERDNASWAKFEEGVEARIDPGDAGRPGSGGEPQCAGGTIDSLQGIEDLEGTFKDDVFYGGPGFNQLLGWEGEDTYFSGAGDDVILANSGDEDKTIDCGEGADTALIDLPPIAEIAAANCETVHKNPPNSFRVETQLPPPPPMPEPPGEESKQIEEGGGGDHAPAKPRPPITCLARFAAAEVHCSQRPQRVGIGALGLVKRLHWRHWGSRRSIGFGRLTVSGGCCDPGVNARAKVRASRLESCSSRGWYTRLKITYGRGYRKTYVRDYPSPTPCD